MYKLKRAAAIAAAAPLLLSACDKGGEDSGGAGTDYVVGFEIQGAVQQFWTGETSAENLCIDLIDPTDKVFSGGELLTLASTEVAADGSFGFTGVTTTSTIGLLMLADDCDGGDMYMGLATGIPSDTVNALDYGDVLSDQISYVVTQETVATFDADLAAAGYTGPGLEVEGAIMGWIISSADLATAGPVDCAYAVPFSAETTCYYADGDDSDGLFTTDGVPNTETRAEAGSFYTCPAATIGTYTAEDCNGSEYYEILAGSIDGLAQFVRIPQITE